MKISSLSLFSKLQELEKDSLVSKEELFPEIPAISAFASEVLIRTSIALYVSNIDQVSQASQQQFCVLVDR